MVVTYETYVSITGDASTASSAVEEALVEAQALVEEELDRPLELEERTELLRLQNGRIYPSATPILDAPFTIDDGYSLSGVYGDLVTGPLDSDTPRVLVTYTGGYTAETLPRRLREAICRAAQRHLHPSPLPADLPTGAEAVRVGDVQITYGSSGLGASGRTLTVSDLKSIRPFRRMEP